MQKIVYSALAVLASASVFVACQERPKDGRHKIECTGYVGNCHEQARKICKEGYLVTNRFRPKKRDGEIYYAMNVRCRQPIIYDNQEYR